MASPSPTPLNISSPFPSPSPDSPSESCDISHLFAYIAIPVVFILSLIGAILPSIINLVFPGRNILHTAPFRFLHGMAGGFIISVALVHSFPEASENLDETDLPPYAWAGMFALIGLIVTWTCEAAIHVYLIRSFASHPDSSFLFHSHSHDHGHHSHKQPDAASEETKLVTPKSFPRFDREDKSEFSRGHAMKDFSEDETHCEHQLEQVVVEQSEKISNVLDYSSLFVLLFGLTFHSFFVGFAIGLENSMALFLAILMHQLFEGMAIGFHLVHAQVHQKSVIVSIVSIFSLSAPIGTCIGLGVQASICHNPNTYNIVAGFFNALSAGILIYVACVHMISEEFSKPDVSGNPFQAFMLWCGVVFGATVMAALGIWA
jgi:zinc transporter 1/2/3